MNNVSNTHFSVITATGSTVLIPVDKLAEEIGPEQFFTAVRTIASRQLVADLAAVNPAVEQAMMKTAPESDSHTDAEEAQGES